MCGNSMATNFRSGWGSVRRGWNGAGDGFVDFGDWAQDQRDQANRFMSESGFVQLHDPLNLFAQQREKFGYNKLENQATERKARAKAEAVKNFSPTPEGPKSSAVLIEPASEIRDRRRRAALMGVSNLRLPGPGANAPKF